MIGKILDRALASCYVLALEAEEGNHGKAGILDFLQFELIERAKGRRLGKTKRVENPSRIARDTSAGKLALKSKERTRLALRARLPDVLEPFQFRKIEEEEHSHQKRVEWDARFVQNNIVLPPFRHVQIQGVGDQDTSHSQHCPPAILQLSIAVPA